MYTTRCGQSQSIGRGQARTIRTRGAQRFHGLPPAEVVQTVPSRSTSTRGSRQSCDMATRNASNSTILKHIEYRHIVQASMPSTTPPYLNTIMLISTTLCCMRTSAPSVICILHGTPLQPHADSPRERRYTPKQTEGAERGDKGVGLDCAQAQKRVSARVLTSCPDDFPVRPIFPSLVHIECLARADRALTSALSVMLTRAAQSLAASGSSSVQCLLTLISGRARCGSSVRCADHEAWTVAKIRSPRETAAQAPACCASAVLARVAK